VTVCQAVLIRRSQGSNDLSGRSTGGSIGSSWSTATGGWPASAAGATSCERPWNTSGVYYLTSIFSL